jgi:hypothetical protein
MRAPDGAGADYAEANVFTIHQFVLWISKAAEVASSSKYSSTLSTC